MERIGRIQRHDNISAVVVVQGRDEYRFNKVIVPIHCCHRAKVHRATFQLGSQMVR